MDTPVAAPIVPLDQLTAAQAGRAGAKAFNCARLRQAGFPVPDGLAVLATATEADIAGLGRHPWLSREAEDVVYAVRSSGIGEDGEGESFAGIHETLLDVPREDLPAAVATCRASGRSAQALEYRRAKGIPSEAIEIGVLIQEMVHPVSAGVAFTVNPVSGARDEIVVNSSWGLGEALVSGQVDPDEFVLAKGDAHLRWSRIGDKGRGDAPPTASLTADQLRDLCALLKDVEAHYGAPQDVEWCHDGSVFWVVQSRPVTTRQTRADETEWTRANIAEVLPDLTSPQALAAFEDLLEQAERRYLGRLKAPDETLGPIVKSFGGRLYFNLSQLRRACALGRVPPALMLRSMGHAGAIQSSDEAPAKPALGDLACLPDLLRILWRHIRVERVLRDHDEGTRAYLSRLSDRDPALLSDTEIWSLVGGWLKEAPEYMQTVLLLGNVLFHEVPVRKVCDRSGFPFDRLVYPQLAAGERSVSAQQAFDLVTLASVARGEAAAAEYLSADESDLSRPQDALQGTEFLVALEAFLRKYGHRGPYEYDWALPRYQEDPTPLLQALRAHLAGGPEPDAAATAARQQREAADAWRAFEERLSPLQRRITLPSVRRSIRTIKQYYVWREKVRSDVARVIGAVRSHFLVLARRFVERGWLDDREDYFLLRLDEVASTIAGQRDPGSLRGIVADRLAERRRLRSLRMPLLMRASELPTLLRMSGVSGGADGSALEGQAVSGGCVEAEVVVVRDPGDFAVMKRGAILVAPATDPSWTPLFTLASGIIVEVGGVLSHASTIAREYGLPALANVKHATTLLKTGERVRLDAVRGVVQRLPPA